MSTSNACAKNNKPLAIWLCTLCLTVLPFGASAQEPPPEDQIPAAEQPAEAPSGKTQAASAISSGFKDPCPLPSAEMAQAPDDLAKIQSDIDRYTLCMERAQLLQRLNDVAMENQEKLNAANGVLPAGMGESNPGMQLDAMPSFAQQRDAMLASVNEGDLNVPPPPPADDKTWYIVKIMGGGANLTAQLSKADGPLAQGRTGDTLSDGARVESVSATSVTLMQDGESKTLSWRENTAAAPQGLQ